MSFHNRRQHHHKRYSEGEVASTTRSGLIENPNYNGTTSTTLPTLPTSSSSSSSSSSSDAALTVTIASYYSSSGLSSSSFAYSVPTTLPTSVGASFSAGTGSNNTATDVLSRISYRTGSAVASSAPQTTYSGSLYSRVATTLATSRTVEDSASSAPTSQLFVSASSTTTTLASPSATSDAISPANGVLTNTNKAILGGVLGGLGGIGLVCALVFVVLNKGNRRKGPDSTENLHTPQRMRDSRSTMRSPLQPKPASRFLATLTLSTSRPHSSSTHRTRKYSEPPSPTFTGGGFQVISGRRLSSPPNFHGVPGEATRTFGSTNSSPRSAVTTPSRRSRLGSTPIIYRDAIGRSQDIGSTISHTSRFIERIDDI